MSCGSYTCFTELILVFRILHGAYSDTKVPVGTTETLRNVYWYCRTYSCISDLIRVLRNLYMYSRSYTCLTKHILVLRILYLYYRTCTYLTDLIRSLFWYKSTRRYYTDSLYEGTCRYYWTYISRRAHIFTYLIFIYLYRNTYTCTCPYHRHILIKSLIEIIEFL